LFVKKRGENSLPKTFSFKFSPDRAHESKKAHVVITWVRPIRGKLRLKVFGKGFGEEPFLRKVLPRVSDIYCYMRIPHIQLSFSFNRDRSVEFCEIDLCIGSVLIAESLVVLLYIVEISVDVGLLICLYKAACDI